MLRPAFRRLALLGGLQRARAAPPGAAQTLHQTRRAFAHRLVGTAVALSLLGSRACAGSAVPRPHHHQAASSMSYTACDDYVVVYVTALEADAKKLATGLLEAQLAACVNIVPSVTSVYRWKGEVCTDTEALLIIKAQKVRTPAAAHLAYLGASASLLGALRHGALAGCRQAHLEELTAWVKKNHTYDEPEVIALPIVGGSAGYLEWLSASTERAL